MWRIITKSAIQTTLLGTISRSICAGISLFLSLAFLLYILGLSEIWFLTISLATLIAVASGIIYQRNECHYSQIEAAIRLTTVLNSDFPLPSLRGWRLSPDAACFLVQFLRSGKIKHVIEIGSGVSTIIIATILKQRGSGKVVAFEHNREQAVKCQSELELFGLSEYAEVQYAPLVEHSISGKSWLWYDLTRVSINHQIDLVLIDGPPVWTQKLARYPALPLLISHLSGHGVILLDDAHRWSERTTLRYWSREYSQIKWVIEPTEDGLAVGTWDEIESGDQC